jgi:hypothetical protein
VEEEEDEEKSGRVFRSRNHVSVSELHMGGFGGEEWRWEETACHGQLASQ